MTVKKGRSLQTVGAAALLDFVYESAVEIGRRRFTTPDDDWFPVLVFPGPSGEMNVVGVPMIEDRKDEVAAAIAALLSGNSARSAAMVVSTWMIARPAEDADGAALRPSQAPDRREALVMLAVDDSSAITRVAFIERHPAGPPTLGPAEDLGDGPDQGGRLIDALRLGVS